MSLKSKKLAEADSVSYQRELTSSIPWPEWSDADLNAEKWDSPKNGTDGKFLDTQSVTMPQSLIPYEWERASQLKGLSDTPIVFVPTVEYPDFITNNKHLLHSEFVRWFVSTMINLQYCGRNGLKVEAESANFTWNGGLQNWQGWLYVYSLNKAGKGAQHPPVINPNGKYIVRLFFMGYWRRFIIDDRIPIDKGGRPLLPCTANNFELWPMLLAKALLKLASLSWSSQREIVDFHPVTCFTGWICLSLDSTHLSPKDKWDFLTKYAEHFEWSPQITETETRDLVSKTSTKMSKVTEEKKKKKKDKSVESFLVPEKPRPVILFARLEDTRDLSFDVVPDITPCWSHPVYIELSRDIPLDPEEVKPPLARWKLLRWVDWAIRRGVINAADYFVPIRCLKLISPLRECKENIVYVYEDINVEEEHGEQRDLIVKEKTKETPKNATSTLTKTSTEQKEDLPMDHSIWGDFNKMSPYCKEIQLFYKPSHFQYQIQVSDILTSNTSQDGTKSKSGTTAKEATKGSSSKPTIVVGPPSFAKSYKWRHEMSKSRNEPLYLLTDSIGCKFILIEFSAMQRMDPLKLSSTRGSTDLSKSSTGSSNFAYLIVEKFSLFERTKEEDPLANVRTLGTRATVLQVEAGRHLFRLFFRSEYSFFVTILSDTIFQVGNRAKMQELMVIESERMDSRIKRISNAVNGAFRAFGTQEYPVELRNYHQSYLPEPENVPKSMGGSFKRFIHDLFLEEFTRIIKRSFSHTDYLSDVLRAMRVFFLNSHIGIESHDHDDFLVVDPNFHESQEMDRYRAAIVIQSFFRMILIKRYLKLHADGNANLKENLWKIAELFNYNKYESIAQVILRNMIKQDPRLKEAYPCSNDFQHILHVQQFTGVLVNVVPNQWAPIVRLMVNAPESEVVFAAVDLFVDLPTYTLRVFNNDNGLEMTRLVNNVIPAHYQHLRLGYTIFGYGWSEMYKYKELDWTIRMVTMKGEPTFRLTNDPAPISANTQIFSLFVEEFMDVYIPNIQNFICRMILEVTTRSVVSFRLSTSYNMVQTKLRVIDEDNVVLCEIDGNSTVILPFAFLEQEERSNQNSIKSSHGSIMIKTGSRSESVVEDVVNVRRYYLEAFVLNNSWPLTETEWTVVNEAKSRDTVYNVRTSRLSSVAFDKRSELSKIKLTSKRTTDGSRLLEPPYWVLQVVGDVGNGLEISQDGRRESEIVALKKSWEADEPGRLQRGRLLRDAFFDEHGIIITASLMSEPRVSMTSSGHPIERSNNSSDSMCSWNFLLSSADKRTLECPPDLRNFLPKLDLTKYVNRDEEEEDYWVKTECDEEMLRNQRAINILDFEHSQLIFVEDMADLLNGQRDRYNCLLGNYRESVTRWRAMMDEAYAFRQKYIEEIVKIPMTTSTSKAKSGTRSKK